MFRFGDKIIESIEDFPADAFGFVYTERPIKVVNLILVKKYFISIEK